MRNRYLENDLFFWVYNCEKYLLFIGKRKFENYIKNIERGGDIFLFPLLKLIHKAELFFTDNKCQYLSEFANNHTYIYSIYLTSRQVLDL